MHGDPATPHSVEALVERAGALDDEDRRVLAEARALRDETFRIDAWRAALDVLGERSTVYVGAWARIGPAYLPERLHELVNLGSRADRDELARWQGVARLARLAIDEALLALLTADAIPPPHVRELYAPWQAMLAAERDVAGP